MNNRGHYNVIIIGAGSAGSALASRLSDNKNINVLLLEEGPYYPTLDQTPEDIKKWHVRGTPGIANHHKRDFVTRINQYQNRDKLMHSGRVIGGTSAVNGAFFLRGLPEDFDDWASIGNDEWSFVKILPYFLKVEHDMDYKGDFHGSSGPLPIQRMPLESLLPSAVAFQKASLAEGFLYRPDMNHPEAEGVGLLPLNRWGGIRVNTAIAYLNPVRHRLNLTIRGSTKVSQILFQDRRAVGVEVKSGGKSFKLYAEEIVLCAGAIGSPSLLMHSGVGPSDNLMELGIPVVHPLPGVGQNLRNHPSISVLYNEAEHLQRDYLTNPIFLRYTASQSTSPKDMTITPDFRQFLNGHPHTAFNVHVELPTSSGVLSLTSSDSDVPPSLDYNISDPWDLERLREGIRLTIKILEHGAFRGMYKNRTSPTDKDLTDNETLNEWILSNVGAAQHNSGTCKMGLYSDPMSVVDQYCKVHGLAGLRVVDASIMPNVVRANPNATCIMIGERVVGWIKDSILT